MWRCLILLSMIVVGTKGGVKTRGSAPGSVPYDKGDVFFPSNGNVAVTGKSQRTMINPTQSYADRQNAYKALSCLNVGSSAGGVGDHKNVIDMGKGTQLPQSTVNTHLVNCSVLEPIKKPDNSTNCADGADIVFLLDSSGSVGQSDFEKMLKFVQSIVTTFTIGPYDVQVGVDTFSSTVMSEFNLDEYNDTMSLKSAIGLITYNGGQTNIADSIRFMVNDSFSPLSGHRQGLPKIAIVITDGGSDNQRRTLVEAKKARDSGIKMIAVGVGKSLNQGELEGIANKPISQYVFNVDSFDVLHTLQATLSTLTCASGNSTNGPKNNGTATGTGSSAGVTKAPHDPQLPVKISTPYPSTVSTTITPTSVTPTVITPAALFKRSLSVGSGAMSPVGNRVKKSEGTGSSAEAQNTCLFFCPPNSNTNSQTSTGTGSSTGGKGNSTTRKNGTAEGTGSSAGGEKTTLAPLVPKVKRSAGIGSSAKSVDTCLYFCPPKHEVVTPETTTDKTTTKTGIPMLTTIFASSTNKPGSSTKKTTTVKPVTVSTGSTMNPGSTLNLGSTMKLGSTINLGSTMNPGSTKNRASSTKLTGSTGTTIGSGVSSLPNLSHSDTLNETKECKDLIDCRVYTKEKICTNGSTYRDWAEVRCKVYCSFCDPHTSPKPCVDKIPNCNEYGGDLCTNPLYRLFREDNCKKFCGICIDTAGTGVTRPANGRRDYKNAFTL